MSHRIGCSRVAVFAARQCRNAALFFLMLTSIAVSMSAALAVEGDVVIGISTSGSSKNVVQAFKAAKEKGAVLIGMTGPKKAEIAELADVCLQVPSLVTARVQECHILVGHMLCAYIDEVIARE